MRLPITESPFFDPSIPRICIVGRPNVGKSTLFNRLLGKRKAITDPTPGVTRDPIRALWNLRERPVILLDTGGLTESKEYLDRLITEKSLKTASEATVLLLVLDVDTGVTGEDEEFIKRMRSFSDRLIVVVNKVDNEKREQEMWNFHSLGLEPVVGISATHGIGLADLREMLVGKLVQILGEPWEKETSDAGNLENANESEDYQDGNDPEGGSDETADSVEADAGKKGKRRGKRMRDGSPVAALGADEMAAWDISIAILGQPNTGKSTLVNTLTGSDLSIVSPVAGTTRDVIEGSFRFQERMFRILDTAGIRRKARVEEDLEYYSVNRAIASIEDADVVLLMVDAQKGLTDQDKKIAYQVVKNGRGIILVLNKWDLMEGLPNQFEAVVDRIRYLFPVLSFAPVMAVSAQKGDGIQPLLKKAWHIREQLFTRIETGRLNNLLRAWVEHTPPPTTRGAMRWKLRYMTQTSVHPVEFVLFVNRTDGFPDAYIGHITNRLRQECGLAEIPFTITLRDGVKRGRS